MTVRPILFSAPMVRALLEGRKTQTRRVLKPQPVQVAYGRVSWDATRGWAESIPQRLGQMIVEELGDLLPYAPGDLLYVREAWRVSADLDELSPADLLPMVSVRYEADNALNPGCLPIINPGRLRPGMHALKRHSRLTLRVTEVRVQRLRKISEEDARAEGADCDTEPCDHARRTCEEIGCSGPGYRGGFASLWQSLNAKRGFGWDVNPWVVCVSFSVIQANVDEVLAGGGNP